MTNRTHWRKVSAVLLLLALLVPILAACGGAPDTTNTTTQIPAAQATAEGEAPAEGQATTAGEAPAEGQATTAAEATPAGQAAPAATSCPSPDDNVAVTLPFFEQGITSFDHAYWTSQLLISQGTIFEGLYGYDDKLNVVPKVAESATPNEDNTVWTFKLRQDKKWSNGDPVTARDFYASWTRALSPELKDSPMWVGMMGSIKNGYAYKAGAVPIEEVGVKLIDDYTIEVTLTQPNAALINWLPVTSAMPINEKSLKEHPNDWWDPKHAVYNGPFVVQSWTSGADTVLARNPNYVGECYGNVTRVTLRPFPDANSRLQAFENGDIHFTFLEDASQLQYAQNIPEMQENMKEDVQNLVWRGIQYNRAVDAGPLYDKRVRQAFAMAIDKQAITDQVLKGLAIPTNAFSGDPRVTEKVTGLPYDVEKAKQLLADAGFPNGQGLPELTFFAPPANDPQMPVIEAVAKMWQDNLGAKIKIQNNEGPVYSTLQWANYNEDVPPGYSTLGGPMNWFQPLDLMLNSGHTFWFMDFKPGGVAKFAEFDDQLAEVTNLTAPGDFAALTQRADAAWTKRQQIISQENNDWGKSMQLEPTFKQQWDGIAKRFQEAKDDAAKLSAYQDALTLVLNEERAQAQYDFMTDENREAHRMMATLSTKTLEDAWDIVIPLQQLTVDAAWMVPIYNDKVFYVTAPQLSGIVLNKLSWGGTFQYQYLNWTE